MAMRAMIDSDAVPDFPLFWEAGTKRYIGHGTLLLLSRHYLVTALYVVDIYVVTAVYVVNIYIVKYSIIH